MTEKLKQIIEDELAKLPKENQEVIASFGWENISEKIGSNYLFSESELNDFQVEVLLILVGLEDPNLFSTQVENQIGTSKEQAKKISEEVFQKIFIPIADELVEKIKKGEQVKNPTLNQTVDFILSSGDYSSFIEKREIKDADEEEEVTKEKIQANLEKTMGTKDKFVI